MRSNEEIVGVIRKAIMVNQFSYADLARRVHISTSAISRYMNNERPFPLNKIEIFARELGVSVEWLIGTTDDTEIFLAIFDQLDIKNKKEVIEYAKYLLEQQNNNE